MLQTDVIFFYFVNKLIKQLFFNPFNFESIEVFSFSLIIQNGSFLGMQ